MKTKANKTAKAKSAKTVKAVNDYQLTNLIARLQKQQSKSLGGVRAFYFANRKEIETAPEFADFKHLLVLFDKLLKDSKEAENYKVLQTVVRTSKKGNYNITWLLQSLRKHAEMLQNTFAENAKKAKATKATKAKTAKAKTAKKSA